MTASYIGKPSILTNKLVPMLKLCMQVLVVIDTSKIQIWSIPIALSMGVEVDLGIVLE